MASNFLLLRQAATWRLPVNASVAQGSEHNRRTHPHGGTEDFQSSAHPPAEKIKTLLITSGIIPALHQKLCSF